VTRVELEYFKIDPIHGEIVVSMRVPPGIELDGLEVQDKAMHP
jgi:hypothetical protein